ncbi:energy transducer TonB [Anaeromusa sp.]|uniref:energy transducer TonB n=1 Tax=Anaeromusa sp. TaxID=1872520 RepID=UPI00260BD0BB|nr:energy transducer TonB [Anaeromusa sp.]MDD3158029.1 energy transducer TonB [Anaeromusa sp.]
MPPRILQRTELIYPDAMRRQRVEGKVIVRMLVLEDGSVGGVSVVTSSGCEELGEAAMATVQ